jgi:hypothetical protein
MRSCYEKFFLTLPLSTHRGEGIIYSSEQEKGKFSSGNISFAKTRF